MKRYWFEFALPDDGSFPAGITLGIGVTGYDYGDALRLIAAQVFVDLPMSPIKRVIDDVDVSTLDQDHVIPNMKPPNLRGIWFPMGYDRSITS